MLAVIAAVITAFGRFDLGGDEGQIARLSIDGIIVNDRLREEKLDRIS